MPVSDAEVTKSAGPMRDDEVFNLPKSPARQAADWATDLIRGMAIGTIGLAGTSGDLREGAASGAEFLTEKLGASPEAAGTVKKFMSTGMRALPGMSGPTSEDISKVVVKPTIGEFGKPNTQTGKYLQSVGEFIPATVGPGGIPKKIAQAVGGGVGSEYAGSKVEEYLGPTAGKIARVLGGALGSFSGTSAANKIKRDTVPTAEMLEKAAEAAYDKAKLLPLQLDKDGMDRLAASIIAELKHESHRDYLSPKTFRAIEELREPAGMNGTVSDIDGVRKLLGRAGATQEERAAANLAKRRIDDYLENIPPNHVVSGDPSQVSQIFREARGNYAPAMRVQQIERAIEKAERAAASSGSGANINNAVRQHLKALRNNEKEMRGWSSDEKEMLDRIIKGGPISNAARSIGKFAPTGVVSSMPTIAAFLGGGNPAALGVAGTGIAGKAIGDHMTQKGVGELTRMLRSRSDLNPGGALPLPQLPEITAIEQLARSGVANKNQ